MEFIFNIDDKTIRFINDNMRSEFLDRVMRKISSAGNYGIIWFAVAFALIAMGGEKRRAGLLMIFSLGVEASVCNLIIKPSVKRVRPNDAHGMVISIDKPKDYSFPSGHTTASFAAGVVWFRTLPARWARVLALASAFLMGFSRLYVGVHYPTDVLAGAVMGTVCALLALWLGKRWKVLNRLGE